MPTGDPDKYQFGTYKSDKSIKNKYKLKHRHTSS